jgi:multiple sugar transport system ATP-binding protein
VVPEQDTQGVHVRLSGKRVALAEGYDEIVGTECILGVRPEAIRFAEGPNAIEVKIEAETPFNEKTVTLVTTKRKREILISRPAGTPAPTEGSATIDIDASSAVLFDRSTGQRIEPKSGKNRKKEAA